MNCKALDTMIAQLSTDIPWAYLSGWLVVVIGILIWKKTFN